MMTKLIAFVFLIALSCNTSKNEEKVKVTATAYMNGDCSGDGMVAVDGKEYTLGENDVTCEEGHILVYQGEKYENGKCVSKNVNGTTMSMKVTWSGHCSSGGAKASNTAGSGTASGGANSKNEGKVTVTVTNYMTDNCSGTSMPHPGWKDKEITLGENDVKCEEGHFLVISGEKYENGKCEKKTYGGVSVSKKATWTGDCSIGSGLGGGAIAGIIIGALVFVGAAAFGVYWFMFRK